MENKARKLSNLSNISNRNFGWSMKPILVLMTFVGQEIAINNNPRKRKACRLLFLIIGLVILLINMFINTISFLKINRQYSSKSIPIYLNYIIGHLFHDLMIIGIPLSFMVIRFFSCRWKRMLRRLEIIQSEMNLSEQFYRKIRNCAILSIIFFLFVSVKQQYFFFDYLQF